MIRGTIPDMHITVTGITLIPGNPGSDTLLIETTLPDGCWPYTGMNCFTSYAAKGSGPDYIAKNFPGVPYHVVTATGLVLGPLDTAV
jgi:hypothetical protein